MTSTPRYTATVTNQTRGWTYTATHGDAGSAAPEVQLADELEFKWGFDQDQVPGHLTPTESTFRLWVRDATKVPTCEKGDRITLDVRLGSAGARILRPAAMKVTGAELELTQHPQYAAQLTVRLVDMLSELPATVPIQGMVGLQGITGMNAASARWRVRFAELACRLLRTIGCPTWWLDDERPLETQLIGGGPTGNLLRGLDQPEYVGTGQRIGTAAVFRYPWDALEAMHRLLNSHAPSAITHTLVAGWSDVASTFPAGWRRIGPDTYWNPYNDANATAGPNPTFVEPQSQDRYYVVPASRWVDGSTSYLPMVFGVMSGVLTLIPNPTASNPRGHRPLAIDAGWCELPARFRKAREHAINRLELVGQETYQQSSGSGPVLREAQRVYDNLTAQLSDGTVTRTLPSSLDLGHAADTYQTEANRFYSPEAANQANLYRTDDSARTPWAPDEFTVHLSRMADSVAANVVTRLCPRQPGETDGDGQVLRHVTVYRLADKDRFADGKPIMGYLTRGVMKIARGDIVFTLNLTPGLPVYTVAVPAPITVGIVDAAAYQAQPLSSIDPLIRIADLAYVAS